MMLICKSEDDGLCAKRMKAIKLIVYFSWKANGHLESFEKKNQYFKKRWW